MGYGHAKQALFEQYRAYFGPFAERRRELEADLGEVEKILDQGAVRAREEAEKMLITVRRAVGLR